MEGQDETRFLPPEPAGPEPELSDRPPRPAEPAPQPQPQPAPQPQQTYGYPPPPGQAPPPGAAPPPGYGYQPPPPQAGYPPPPGYGYQPQWGYAPQPPVADNGQAVLGFVLSLVAIGLLVISFGLSSVVSLGCAIAGVVCSRNGKRRVDAGQTPKHRGLAQAGFVVGWVGVGLSILATAAWIVAVAAGALDTDTSGDPRGFDSLVSVMVGA